MNNFDKILNINRKEGNRYSNKGCIEFYRELLKNGKDYWEVIFDYMYVF